LNAAPDVTAIIIVAAVKYALVYKNKSNFYMDYIFFIVNLQ